MNALTLESSLVTPAAALDRRSVLVKGGWAAVSVGAFASHGFAQARTPLRVSTAAVPDDWHAKMWTVFKDSLDKALPGQFDVQINLNASLFKQGAEPAAMARGNLELAAISAFDIAKLVPEFSIFTAGYVVRDAAHQQKIFNGPIGQELFKLVAQKLDVTVLATAYLGTRQLNLRDTKVVRVPSDLKEVKLRMPASKEWLFLGDALGAKATPLAFGEVYLALKTGTIDAQDNPLPTVRAAKFHEVTRQLVLTGHLTDSLFMVVSNKALGAMSSSVQTALRQAAATAALFNNDNRQKEELQIVDHLKSQGLQVSVPDVGAFRAHVQQAYLKSELAKTWPTGLLERINAVK